MADETAPATERRDIGPCGHEVWFNGVRWFHVDPADDDKCEASLSDSSDPRAGDKEGPR